MSTDEDKKQEAEWQALHDLITATMDEFGLKDPVRKGDYWLLDENLGPLRQEVEVQNLSLLQPHVIRSLQGLLAKYRQWHITVRVDVPGTEQTWPSMGLFVYHDTIIDELQRQYFPEEFQHFFYEGST